MRRLFLALSLAVAVVGCGGGSGGGPIGSGDSSPTSSAPQLRIWVTDAPFPFEYVESASVVIREVQLHDVTAGRWIVPFSGEAEIDLVPLANGVQALLVELSPPPGTYEEVRLIVDAGRVVLRPEAIVEQNHIFTTENGRLHFPSGAKTGIKVKVSNQLVVATQLSSDLVLDFDLSRNFTFNGPVDHAPGVKRVIFTPVVRALNSSTAGTLKLKALTDNLTPDDAGDDSALSGATVRILDVNDTVLVTASTDAEGLVAVKLPAGTYDVEIEAAGHVTTTVADAEVFLANLHDLGDVLLEAAGEIRGAVLSDGGTSGESDDVVVQGVTVELWPAGEGGPPLATTTTDANGLWTFGGLTAGDYDLTFTAAGFTSESLDGVASELVSTGYSILLEALPQSVVGTITVPEGTDVTSVTIEARNAAGVLVGTTAPDDNGDYSLPLATGSYEITFDDGADPQTASVTLVGANPEPAPVVLDASFE